MGRRREKRGSKKERRERRKRAIPGSLLRKWMNKGNKRKGKGGGGEGHLRGHVFNLLLFIYYDNIYLFNYNNFFS